MDVRLLRWKDLSAADRSRLFTRSGQDIEEAVPRVRAILEAVRTRGDAALVEYSRTFDGADLSGLPLRMSEAEIDAAERGLDGGVKAAIRACADNVRRCHEAQLPGPMEFREIRPGVRAGERATPVPSVGLYVPRGRGSFPSSTYMMTVPASVAGVPRIVVVSPPDAAGRCDPATLFTARLCGADEIYRVGGVQALAALAWGTESIRPVVKLLGPGSRYVAAAKRLLAGVVDTGLPAGPTESAIIADETADPALVALDLLIEAEHGSDSQALLLTPSEPLAREVARLLPEYLAKLPEPRRTFAADTLAGYGGIVITADIAEAAGIANELAPEHLQIATAEPLGTLSLVRHAGEVLLGQHTPFSLANYAIGVNAVLPTGGAAKTWSALSVRDFMKWTSVAWVTGDGYDTLRDQAIALADYEGFPAHALALRERRRR
ncbi:MAG: histidinol dehydrogenase [Spirochaetes bacterium]|nr:histidinol dehydrogenase [Spirochaetota bacterium]